ncbi:MAG: hypothetical protein IH851_13865 [Armatimonadetes bacterium]|nr:hypothetical protein [Armatimonadota bacterium]
MLAALLAAAFAAVPQAPDFAGTISTPKMQRTVGEYSILLILWDPHRPDHPAPAKQQIEDLVFGQENSVAGWFFENSHGKFRLKRAGILGWYDAAKPGDHYWESSKEKDPEDSDGDGFLSGHTEKWAEAVRLTDQDFDFAEYDRDGDGVLEPHELGILMVIPQNNPFGTMRTPAGAQYPEWAPLIVDGVRIPLITEAYAGKPPNLGLFAHELSHILLGAPDMYMDTPYRPGVYSLMDRSYAPCHLDPFEKLKLGWLRYRVVTESGEYLLRDVETSGEALILYDPSRGPSEYFIVENRYRGDSYDAGALPSDGLAIWHIVEDPAVFDKMKPTAGGNDEWGRRGIRLLRANGGNPIDDKNALFGRGVPCRPTWSDGTPTPFSITLTSAGSRVRVQILRSRDRSTGRG